MLVLIRPRVRLSRYQVSAFQKVCDNSVKTNTNMHIIVLPFMKKREEEITGQQGNRNLYQVKSISYLGKPIFINKSLPQAGVSFWGTHK